MDQILRYQEYELKTLRRQNNIHLQTEDTPNTLHTAHNTLNASNLPNTVNASNNSQGVVQKSDYKQDTITLHPYPLSYRDNRMQVAVDGIDEISNRWAGKEVGIKRVAQMDCRFFRRLESDSISYRENISLPPRTLLRHKYTLKDKRQAFLNDLNFTKRNIQNINLTAQDSCRRHHQAQNAIQDQLRKERRMQQITIIAEERRRMDENNRRGQIKSKQQSNKIKKQNKNSQNNTADLNKKQIVQNQKKKNNIKKAIAKRVKLSGITFTNSNHRNVKHQNEQLKNTFNHQCKFRKQMKEKINITNKN